jgi:L-fucose mutarotase/ribose pyranase (RbsD/FucU family)
MPQLFFRWFLISLAILLGVGTHSMTTTGFAEPLNWKQKLETELATLGHRNWILVADSAYPAQTSAGIEVVVTNASHFEVLEEVFEALSRTRHVSPIVYLDAEQPYVADKDAPGMEKFRKELQDRLRAKPAKLLPHMELILKLEEASKNFRVLVLKTKLTLPYTSVFLELDCGYWSPEAEARMREAMKQGKGK